MASPLNDLSLAYAEELYARYAQDPASVTEEWRAYFEQSMNGDRPDGGVRIGPSFAPRSVFSPVPPREALPAARQQLDLAPRAVAAAPLPTGSPDLQFAALQDRVDQLIRAYRVRGHLAAELDPLGRPRPKPVELDPGFYGLTEAHLDMTFSVNSVGGHEQALPLREVLRRMRSTYCRRIGVQFMHMDDPEPKRWVQERMERTENQLKLYRGDQLRIFTKLTDAVILEEFIQKKFIGAKSFSLEGAESLIPLLDLALERAGEHGIREVVLGMAHRGRLNVLVNIMGKSARQIFREFEDKDHELYRGGGDVKYHMGHSSDWTTSSGKKLHLSLCFNPSHLEFVNTVAIGRVRAKQDRTGDKERKRGLCILIHGDAAFAGEGIVQETLNLSELPGYHIGGTLHIVLNNQIGFTTPPEEGRSCPYATDIARMLQIPIFHVNGEDPEAVAQVILLAMDFRRQFKRDVVIDMYGYRRRGHNETDEPHFTQPLMYQAIERQPSVRHGYLERLLKLGELTQKEADEIADRRRDALEKSLTEARTQRQATPFDTLGGLWKGFIGGKDKDVEDVETGVAADELKRLMEALTTIPPTFTPHKKIERLLEQRRLMGEGKKDLDWASAEALAFASLAKEGTRIRFTGQDSERGTFSQRHAVLVDQTTGRKFMALGHLGPNQGPVEIYNSPLSEMGVLGFEYGYSLDTPDGLVLWEAQFGDFVNTAQVILDQFVASTEDKWQRLCSLVLLLPHGYEGMGPEHSSARLERFLQLAAEDNIQVCYPTTPAQYFHMLRRQVLRRWRKPLVVMTPKSLLRHPECVSPLEELTKDRFRRVLDDPTPPDPSKTSRVLLCTGKIYYELLARRRDHKREDVAIIRLEQLYPFPDDGLKRCLARYPDETPVVWVQEEPENMGAWRYIRARFGDYVHGRLRLSGVSRPESASPATGSPSSHKIEQEEVLDGAFAGAV